MSEENIYDVFEKAFQEVESKKKEWMEAHKKLIEMAPKVLNEAGEPTEPVDVADVISKIGQGLSVRDIEVSKPTLSEAKIRSYEGEYNAEIEKNAARIRKIVSLAAMVAVKPLTSALPLP